MEFSFTIFFNKLNLNNFFDIFFSETKDDYYNYLKVNLSVLPEIEFKYSVLDYNSYIFMQKDGYIVYINNLKDYNDVYAFIKSHIFNALTIRVSSGCYYLTYYHDCKTRVIYSLKDGSRWVFYQNGTQQSFEENDEYSEKGATKKFNLKKMKKFCKNMGVDLDDPDFFKPVSKVYYTYRIKKVPKKKVVTYDSNIEEKYKEIIEFSEGTNILLKDVQRDNDGNILSDEICEIQWTDSDGVREYYIIDSEDEKILKRLRKIKRSAKKKGVKIIIEYCISPNFVH